MKVKEFFAFDLMVLPFLIKVFFVLGILLILAAAVWFPFSYAQSQDIRMSQFGARVESEFSFGRFIVGGIISFFIMILSLVWWRILCETMIVLFKIHEDLVVLRPKETKPE